jgi:very-short-patch-repair endonuclease
MKFSLEDTFNILCREAGLFPKREFRFSTTRGFRFDFAWPDERVGVEIEGDIWGRPVYCHACGSKVQHRLKDGRLIDVRAGGRHNTGSGFADDCEKYNLAAREGWAVLRFTDVQLRDIDECIAQVRELLALRRERTNAVTAVQS